MNKKILLIGGGSHCKVILDSLLQYEDYDISIIDKKENIGKSIMGIKIIGSDDDIARLYSQGYKYAFISLGSIGNPKIRIKLFDMIDKIGFEIPNIIDKSAVISRYAKLQKGIFVGKKSVINSGSVIENGCIINTGVIIEHDCVIKEFVHIASGTVLGGNVTINKNTHIGSNSTIRNNLTIGKNTIIGIASVITKNIGDNKLAYGNPCKEIKKI